MSVGNSWSGLTGSVLPLHSGSSNGCLVVILLPLFSVVVPTWPLLPSLLSAPSTTVPVQLVGPQTKLENSNLRNYKVKSPHFTQRASWIAQVSVTNDSPFTF